MLAAPFRLTSKTDFLKVRDKGVVNQFKNFSLSVYKRNDTSPSRFGFVVPVKLFPNAVDRNRVKRMLSESARYQITYVAPGFDCVFLPRQTIIRAYAADLMNEVKDAFERAGIIKK